MILFEFEDPDGLPAAKGILSVSIKEVMSTRKVIQGQALKRVKARNNMDYLHIKSFR